MKKLHASLREIKAGYRGLKYIAKKRLLAKDYDTAISFIGHCVSVASQFNWIYADEEIEDMLTSIAKATIDSSQAIDFQPKEDHWVFYDDYCTSYVLALQWMNALSKTGRKILYITSRLSSDGQIANSILPLIENLPNVIIEEIQDGPYFTRANRVFQSILGFKASKLILHKTMNSLVQLPLCVLPNSITTYNINLGDQFFWLGTKVIDYNIEFRPFGASISLQQRGFQKEQLLMIPFYPANEGRPFEGFPEGCRNRIVIFSGGDYYKTQDIRGTYWRHVKNILNRHKNVAFLFATKSDPIESNAINHFIKENNLEDQFYYINFRQDIYQVFAHCDIYMGTYPISGSLMSQLAAINGKPILQYYAPGTTDDETEQALCINDKFKISFNSEKEFLEEADHLIYDIDYRVKQGARLKAAMMQPEQFDEIVKQTLFSNASQLPIEFKTIDYKQLDRRWFMLEKCGFTDAGVYIRSLLGKKLCIRYAPKLFIKVFLHQISIPCN